MIRILMSTAQSKDLQTTRRLEINHAKTIRQRQKTTLFFLWMDGNPTMRLWRMLLLSLSPYQSSAVSLRSTTTRASFWVKRSALLLGQERRHLGVCNIRAIVVDKSCRREVLTTSRSISTQTHPLYSSNMDDIAGVSSSTKAQHTESSNSNNNKIVVIAGCTGVGKSDVAATLCHQQARMIVSADSVQAYPGVQIGANKPTLEELSTTPHLLVNICPSANVTYNAAAWTRDALYAIDTLLQRPLTASQDDNEEVSEEQRQRIDASIQEGKRIKGLVDTSDPILPIVVGGTMMYLQWLVHGRPDAMRPTPQALEKAIKVMTAYETSMDWKGAVEHVLSHGDVYQAPVDKLCGKDWYRLRRILEVAYTVQEQQSNTGRQESSTQHPPPATEDLYSGQRRDGLKLWADVRCFFLCPTDRIHHGRLVDKRCEDMISRGLLTETTDLELAGELPEMAAKAIGYRQVLEYLERPNPKDNDEEAFLEFLRNFTTATRRYSKRQMQWFRRDQDFVFVPVDTSMSDKSERIKMVAKEIEERIGMNREQFDAERLLQDESSPSFKMRKENEAQGKGMRTYQFERQILLPGSDELQKVLQEADECTHRMQAKRRRLESPSVDNGI